MDKETAIQMIDDHKNALINPVEMLNWTWLRVIINQITKEEWQTLLARAHPILSA